MSQSPMLNSILSSTVRADSALVAERLQHAALHVHRASGDFRNTVSVENRALEAVRENLSPVNNYRQLEKSKTLLMMKTDASSCVCMKIY